MFYYYVIIFDMDIGDYAAIYAAIIATSLFIWTLRRYRNYLEFAEFVTGKGDDLCVDVHVTNKTGQLVTIMHIVLIDRNDYFHTVVCGVGSFKKGHHSIIIGTGKDYIDLENEARCVFWINVKDIKQSTKGDKPHFTHFGIIDDNGRTHKHRIPKRILNMFNN